MSRALYSKVVAALGDRSIWENRQRMWYTMRHNGLARRNKPYPGAADLHFPLIDQLVDKFKPFYFNSVFTSGSLATFTPLLDEQKDTQGAAEACFDWLTRNETNFEEEFDSGIDSMLLGGRTVIKQWWDEDAGTEGAVVYDAIDPLFIVVPNGTNDLETASWVCHVKQVSVTDYKQEKLYNQNPDLILRIRGKGEEHLDTAGREQEKATREGITYSDDKGLIVLFEVWVRKAKGWVVHTFSPAAPAEPVRPPYICPYKRRGKAFLPFVSLQFETKDKGWYSPRGVAERSAAHETYLCKLWNTKADGLDFCSKPLFTSDQPLATNTGNVRFRPGDYLPPGTSAVQMPSPPVALDAEMNNTRQIAQESIQVPDFGSSEEGGPVKTATETQYVRSFASQGIQYRGRGTFRSLCKVFRNSWALWVQFGGKKLAYVSAQQRKVLPAEAAHDNYFIEPNGSPDQWNRMQLIQRAVARFNMFRGHPNVNQEELVKTVLEADDPRLVKRLFITTNVKSANEAEDEAIEIGALLMNGWPAAVSPGENHVLRLRILASKLQQLAVTGAPVDPVAKQRLQEHMAMHLQLLKQENPAMARQFAAAMHAVDPTAGAGAAPIGAPGSVSQTPSAPAGGPVAIPREGGGLPPLNGQQAESMAI